MNRRSETHVIIHFIIIELLYTTLLLLEAEIPLASLDYDPFKRSRLVIDENAIFAFRNIQPSDSS